MTPNVYTTLEEIDTFVASDAGRRQERPVAGTGRTRGLDDAPRGPLGCREAESPPYASATAVRTHAITPRDTAMRRACCWRRLRTALLSRSRAGLRGTVRDAAGRHSRRHGHADQSGQRRCAARRPATTAGEYRSRACVPGVYTVRASVAGFKTFERKDARIGTQQFLDARHRASRSAPSRKRSR